MLKRWNMGLIVGTFLLTIFGTFITRSGVIASVHSFTQSAVGYFFLAFLLVAGILSFTLLYTRWPLLEPEAQLESMVSREGAFLYNNLALLGIAFSVLWGTLFPILSEAVRGTKITVGPPFFNRVNIPLGLFLLFLTGVGPLIAWRKASIANLQRQFIAPLLGGLTALTALLVAGLRSPWALVSLSLAGFVLVTVIQEFGRGVRARMTMHGEGAPIALARLVARNRRRYGGYIVHVAMLIYFVAFTGLAFPAKTTVDLQPGQQTTLKSPFGHTWTFTHLGVSQYSALNRRVSAATVELARDGKRMGTIKSEKRQHVDSFGRKTFEASTEVGIRSDLLEDVYVVYAGSPDGTERASYSLLINPLVGWFWIGGAILTLGGLLTMWPGGPQVKVARRRASIQAGYTVPLAGVAE